ncbi:hypothetical protein [Belliella pelovolcani]|jgi:hypothetical protein|uniref:hypothetical protein n=1 Tax=Belliella pelovolcani TaxID=529505 RepID=UPI003919C6A1
MKKIFNFAAILSVMVFASSCILEDVEPEYEVVGAVGTISGLTASSTSPSEGQTVTFTVNFYSEHENATELRMNRISGGTATTITTRNFTTWNTQDSYVETFQYQVPSGTAGSTVTIQFQLITQSGFSTTRNINLNVQSGG